MLDANSHEDNFFENNLIETKTGGVKHEVESLDCLACGAQMAVRSSKSSIVHTIVEVGEP